MKDKEKPNDFFITGKITDYLNYKGVNFTDTPTTTEGINPNEQNDTGTGYSGGEYR